jgi:tetratricopeptide (TPR) repeat protein
MVETSIRLPTKRELVQEAHPAPEQACVLSDLATRISKEGKLDAAIVAIRRALAIAPDHPVLLSHLGAFLWDVAQYDEAESVLRRSIEIEPNYAPSRGNLGSALGAQQKFGEAVAMYESALAIEPDWNDGRWNYAITLLDAGAWREGWSYYDARLLRGDKRLYPSLPYPEWKGEDLSGKTLWVQGEQGVGDRILFSRYLAWVKELFPTCRILLQMDAADLPNIANLMWAYRDLVEFVPNGTPWQRGVDYGIYLMSLPRLHGTTPDNVPADPGLILQQAMAHRHACNLPEPLIPGIKVGVVWSGGRAMKRNIERSVPFEVMMRLAELPNVVLYSMQFDCNDLFDFGADMFIRDLSRDIGPMGFCGTAAAMLNLDLVITACTATAHLAGALNVPCWTLLNANPYWVWLRDRSDSVWYPNMRLFRQTAMYDWAPVFESVRSELVQFAAAKTGERKAA